MTRRASLMHARVHAQASEDRELATFLGSVQLLSSLTQAELGRHQL